MNDKVNHKARRVGYRPDLEIYDKISMKDVEGALAQITNGKGETKRKFKIGTGKGGYIMGQKALYKTLGFTEEEISVKVKELEVTLPEGYYELFNY